MRSPFYSMVAWQLLALTATLRANEEAAATPGFDEKELTILANTSRQPLKTVKAARFALAKLVGFAPSRKQPLRGGNGCSEGISVPLFHQNWLCTEAFLKPLQD